MMFLLYFQMVQQEKKSVHLCVCFQVALVVKNTPASAGDAGDMGLIPGSERSPRGGNGNPFQYSCQDNPTDRGTWWLLSTQHC